MLNNFIPSMFSSLNGGEVGVSIMHCTALRVLPTFPPIVYHTYSIQGKYRKVASSRPVYFSILDHILHKHNIKIPLHNQSGDVKMCYEPRQSTARDFTVLT